MTTIDKVLIGCASFLIAFTITMIILFCLFQQVPDTLIECVFGALAGEGVISFAIWWIKRKQTKEEKKNE